MTFTMQVKEEISKEQLNEIENRNLLLGYLLINSEIKENNISIFLENASVARKLFKTLKYCYGFDIHLTSRTQKKFMLKTIYILSVNDKNGNLQYELNNLNLSDKESKTAFIKGVFLSSGSINDPKKSRYHLELSFIEEEKAKYVLEILISLNHNFKLIKRNNGYMLYLKASEEISDFLKSLNAVNSLFYFEDIRIYRDHKNMVNRLNNCEQANLEKLIKTSDKQLEMINFLNDNDYLSLLDEKSKQVALYRLKYPEISFQSLADIISSEIGKKVSKSYVNHHFRKITDIYTKIIE